jgi:hypothetical protein
MKSKSYSEAAKPTAEFCKCTDPPNLGQNQVAADLSSDKPAKKFDKKFKEIPYEKLIFIAQLLK